MRLSAYVISSVAMPSDNGFLLMNYAQVFFPTTAIVTDLARARLPANTHKLSDFEIVNLLSYGCDFTNDLMSW